MGVSLLGLPEFIGKTVFLFLALGFVPALIFAWVYEMTPEGLKLEKDVDRSQSITTDTGGKINVVIVVMLALAIAAVVVDRLIPEEASNAAVDVSESAPSQSPAETDSHTVDDDGGRVVTEPSEASIAVLPFENFSGNPEDEYFSDGLSDTVLHQLAQISELKVIARNSSFQFKGTNLDVREVGERLGVANILEGSVQRQGDQVRVIAQLVRASDGSHVWSQTFDYRMDDIFAMHDAIALAVAEEMKVSLLAEDATALGMGGTENPKAYDKLLQGTGAFMATFTPALADKVDPDVDFAPMQLIDQALALDPDYVDALIAKVHVYNMFAFQTTSFQDKRRYVERARPLVERVLELAPEYSGAWAAEGTIAHRAGEHHEAMAAYRKAIELNPNDASAHLGLAVVSMASAPLDTIKHMRIMQELDPENPFKRPLVGALARLNRIDEAIAELKSGITGFAGIDQMVMDDLAEIYYVAKGRPDESALWAGKLLAMQPDSQRGLFSMSRAWQAVGDFDRARRWLAVAGSAGGESYLKQTMEIRLAAAKGDWTTVRAVLGSIERLPAGPGLGSQLDFEARLCLAMSDLECAGAAVRGLGQALEASAVRGRMSEEWRVSYQMLAATLASERGESPDEAAQYVIDATRPMPRAAWFGDSKRYTDAEAFVLLGKREFAVAALEETLLPEGGFMPLDAFLTPADIGLILSRLEGDPQFEDWRKRFRERREAARERLLEMEEFEEIPAPPDA